MKWYRSQNITDNITTLENILSGTGTHAFMMYMKLCLYINFFNESNHYKCMNTTESLNFVHPSLHLFISSIITYKLYPISYNYF